MSSLSTTLLPAGEVSSFIGLGVVASGVSQVHGLWKWYRFGETYTNTDNALPLLIGNAFESFILPDNTLLKLPAVPFYLGSRLLDLFAQEDNLHRACSKLKQAVFCTLPVNPKTEWIAKSPLDYVISRYKITWWVNDAKSAAIRLHRVALVSLEVGLETFKLVMRIVDVIEIFSLDPDKMKEIARKSIREGGIHIPRCLNALVKNQNIFLERLNSQNLFGYGISAVGGNPEKVKEIAQTLFNNLETGLDIYQKASVIVGDGAAALAKKSIYDILSWFASDEMLRKYYNPDDCILLVEKEPGLVSFKNISRKISKKNYIEVIVPPPESLAPTTTSKPLPNVFSPRPNLYYANSSNDTVHLFQSPVKRRSMIVPQVIKV